MEALKCIKKQKDNFAVSFIKLRMIYFNLKLQDGRPQVLKMYIQNTLKIKQLY